jgi:hypothetical protein
MQEYLGLITALQEKKYYIKEQRKIRQKMECSG